MYNVIIARFLTLRCFYSVDLVRLDVLSLSDTRYTTAHVHVHVHVYIADHSMPYNTVLLCNVKSLLDYMYINCVVVDHTRSA